MKTLNLIDRELSIKSDFNEINLNEFAKIMKVSANGKYDIDTTINILSVLTGLSYDELEELYIDDLKLLSNYVKDSKFQDISVLNFIGEFNYNGVKYKTSFNGNFNFKVKEINQIEKRLKNKKELSYTYIIDIAAILFREVDENDVQLNNFDDDSINKRKEIFGNNMSINFLAAYLNQVHKHFNEN